MQVEALEDGVVAEGDGEGHDAGGHDAVPWRGDRLRRGGAGSRARPGWIFELVRTFQYDHCGKVGGRCIPKNWDVIPGSIFAPGGW